MGKDELAKLNNYHAFDQVNKPYEPLVQPFSYFYLAIQGEIESGQFMDLDGLAVKYDFVAGDEWELASGAVSGQGQFSFKGQQATTSGKRNINWGLPFEAQYRSMSPSGWPRMVIYCLGKASDGTEYVKAYGSTSIPTVPG